MFKRINYLTVSVLAAFITLAIAGCKPKAAEQPLWSESYEWQQGLNLLPHESTNQVAFDKLYASDKAYWDMAFNWMKSNDLTTLEPGRYIIDTNNVTATISRVATLDKDSVRWEAHRKYSDIQYIIEGKTEMGVAPLAAGIESVPFDTLRDIGFYTVSQEMVYPAEPGTFFIFTPDDIHRPATKYTGFDTITKLVMKIRASE